MPLVVTTEEDEVETRLCHLGRELAWKSAMYGGITHISAVAVTSDLGKRGRHRIGGQYRRQGSLPGAWIRTSPHPSRWICDAPYPGRITDPIHVL